MVSSAIPSSAPLVVVIGTEFDDYDGEIYRVLLEMALLDRAAADGVQHALFAIDNDGGSVKRPAHSLDHVSSAQAAEENDGCRYCWLREAIPSAWRAAGGLQCLVVPIQTLETWLLAVDGYAFSAPTPEQLYHRAALKKAYFGKPLPSVSDRLDRAKAPGRRRAWSTRNQPARPRAARSAALLLGARSS